MNQSSPAKAASPALPGCLEAITPVEEHSFLRCQLNDGSKETPCRGPPVGADVCADAAPGSSSSCPVVGGASTFETSSSLDFEDLSCFSAPTSALPEAPATLRTLPGGRRIARISDETAAALSSQQVVIDLRSICKELVENALDAGSTSIEVRLMDCGLGGVEVRDNGSGISPEDLELIGCRHATSKISSFDDVYSKLDSLGFRGEALSSLCFVARVSIVTRCRSADFGTRVFFDAKGKQVAREAAAREVGTTVSVEDIFGRMPLRRRTMEQTKQRQLQDALALLQRIALLHATSCRIVFSNFDPRTGGRSTFLATKGTSSGLLEAALSVYGAKQLAACSELMLSGTEPGREWRLAVVISRPPHGIRSTALQHFYVRRRPVEFPPLLQKLLNKKWKEVSSRGLFPVCLGFLELDASLLDINVRKDKQQVLLAVEKDIAHALLEAVSKVLAPSVASFKPDGPKKQCQLEIQCSSTPAQLPESLHPHREAQPVLMIEQQQQQDLQKPVNHQQQPANPQPHEGDHAKDGLQAQEERHQERQKQQTCEQEQSEGPPAITCSDKGAPTSVSEGPGGEKNAYSASSLLSNGARFPEVSLEEGRETLTRQEIPAQRNQRLNAAHLHSALPLHDATQIRRPLLTKRQRVTVHLPGEDLQASEPPQKKFGQPPEGHQRHSAPSSKITDSAQEDERAAGVCAVHSTASDSSAAFASLQEASAGPHNLAVSSRAASDEADLVCDEILAAAVGELCIDLDEMFDVRRPTTYPATVGEEDVAAAQNAGQSSVGPALPWLDTPEDFSLCAEDFSARGMSKASQFFLFKKDFFTDLALVGQFNEGFIIAALRGKRPSCSVSGQQNAAALEEADARRIANNSVGCSKRNGPNGDTVTSLFIIDQHASDEKRIFEALNAEFHPRMQPLIAPLKLSLPADLLAAVEAFAPHLSSNGFACVVCGACGPERPLQANRPIITPAVSQRPCVAASVAAQRGWAGVNSAGVRKAQQPKQLMDASGTDSVPKAKEDETHWDPLHEEGDGDGDGEGQRHCYLTGLPVIEGRQLSASDFIEFLGALASEDQGKAIWKGTMPQPPVPPNAADQEGAGSAAGASPHHRVLQYRPSRVWEILASKACRSAIMIGDPLAPHKQVTILRRMAGLQLPFNCPHGRPTMRHLIDLCVADRQPDKHVSQQSSEKDRRPLRSGELQSHPASIAEVDIHEGVAAAAAAARASAVREDVVSATRRQSSPPDTLEGGTQDQMPLSRGDSPSSKRALHAQRSYGNPTAGSASVDMATSPPEDMPPLFSEDESQEDSVTTRSWADDTLRGELGRVATTEEVLDDSGSGVPGLRLTIIG
ncbi:mismatch repair endonuclease PMS2 [Cyclospora cayetanensis]|nr:mismatch repair endonuclease PMS2 [Cyclospora cayetanensis]